MKKEKPYFNSNQQSYHRRCVAWHDVSTIEEIRALEAAHDEIRGELLTNLADAKTAALCFKKFGLKNQKGWRQIELRIYGVDYPERIALFPQTMKVLEAVPGVATAYFSVLSPQTSVAPHVGDTDAFYRVHLGLKIPSGLPDCGIEVAGVAREWQEGKCIAFNDAYFHTAWNHTNEQRIVLIVDILRPEFYDQALWVNAGVRATLYYARLYERLFFVIELLPRVLTRLIRPSFHWVAYFWHKLRVRKQ